MAVKHTQANCRHCLCILKCLADRMVMVWVITLLQGGVRRIIISISVGLSVRSRISETIRPNFTNFCAYWL